MSRVFASRDRVKGLIALYKGYTFLSQTPFFPDRMRGEDDKWQYYNFCANHFKDDITIASRLVPNIWKAFELVLG